MVFVMFWFGFSIAVGIAASRRGRSAIGWALLALLISPLLSGLILLALPRHDLLSDIVTIAMVEATPEGSRARQLFAEREAKLARIKEEGIIMATLLGSSDNRPWSTGSSSATNHHFVVLISIWIIALLAVGLSLMH